MGRGGGGSVPGLKKIGTHKNTVAEPLFEEDKPYYVL